MGLSLARMCSLCTRGFAKVPKVPLAVRYADTLCVGAWPGRAAGGGGAGGGGGGEGGMPSPPRREAREKELKEAYVQLGDANEVGRGAGGEACT